MKNTFLSFLLLISLNSLILAQPIQNDSKELVGSLKKCNKRTNLPKSIANKINSTTGTCISNAGTISSTLDGDPTISPIYVCYNSCYTLASNNDYILPIPVVGETSELFYALYIGQPNLSIGPDSDPSFTGLFWTDQNLSDCNNVTSILLGIGLGNHFWLVPITVDDGDSGGNPNASIGYDNNGDLCYDYGNPIEIVYLPQLNSSTDVTMCNSYLWSSNNQTYTASGTYTTSVTSVSGCDSIVTLNLTILDSSSSSTVVTICNEYTWNNNTYSTSGIYTFTTPNAIGCDSIAKLYLTILDSSSSSAVVTMCNNYTWNSINYTTSGVYTFNTTNAAGCDSVAVLYLTINDSSSSTLNITACSSYTWNNVNYTSGGTYIYTTTNVVGCDSIATLNLIVNSVNTSVTQAGSSLSSDLIGATSYQWVDCDNNFALISGENNQQFNSLVSGNFAAIITENACVDTSTCFNVNVVGIYNVGSESQIKLFPNPFLSILHVSLKQELNNGTVKIISVTGSVVYEMNRLYGKEFVLNIDDLAEGVYFLYLTDNKNSYKKIIVHQKN